MQGAQPLHFERAAVAFAINGAFVKTEERRRVHPYCPVASEQFLPIQPIPALVVTSFVLFRQSRTKAHSQYFGKQAAFCFCFVRRFILEQVDFECSFRAFGYEYEVLTHLAQI